MKTSNIHSAATIILGLLFLINIPFAFQVKYLCDGVEVPDCASCHGTGCGQDYRYSFTSILLFDCPFLLFLTGLITLVYYQVKKKDPDARWLSALNLVPLIILTGSAGFFSVCVLGLCSNILNLGVNALILGLNIIYAVWLLRRTRTATKI